MIRVVGVLFLFGTVCWAAPILVLLVRETHRRGLDRVHAGRSWAPRDES